MYFTLKLCFKANVLFYQIFLNLNFNLGFLFVLVNFGILCDFKEYFCSQKNGILKIEQKILCFPIIFIIYYISF